jgi:hypothetical protein
LQLALVKRIDEGLAQVYLVDGFRSIWQALYVTGAKNRNLLSKPEIYGTAVSLVLYSRQKEWDADKRR